MFEFKKSKPLCDVDEFRPEFWLKDFLPIPKESLTMLSGAGGSGKSFLALQIALRFVEENKDKKILLWLSEDPAGTSKDRANLILKNIMNTSNTLENIFLEAEAPEYIIKKSLDKFEEFFRGYDLVVLDPLIAFYVGDENNNAQARRFMNYLNMIAKKNKQSFLIIHHVTKALKEQESRTRGASAFTDAVRLAYEIKPNTVRSNTIDVSIKKDNFGVKTIMNSDKKLIILPFDSIVDFKTVKKSNTTINNKSYTSKKDEEILSIRKELDEALV